MNIVRLLEFEAKEIFEVFDLPLVNRWVLKTPKDFDEKVKLMEFPAIIKSQIAIGSRKKAGLIKIAQSKEEARSLIQDFFTRKVSGFSVEAILIEQLVEIEHEYYCSIALNPSGREFLLMASAEGGIEIEEVAHSAPDKIIKLPISITNGLNEHDAHKVGKYLGLEGELLSQIVSIFQKLWKITLETDAQLVEINPLVKTPNGLFAIDGKMIVDDNAIYRRPLLQDFAEKKKSELEKTADSHGFSFVELEGDIGILANGAGLTMALLDLLSENLCVGSACLMPANFLDVGGGASQERVYESLKLILKLNPKAVLINIFGGITRCDIVASAIVQTLNDIPNTPPIAIRLTGTNEKEGFAILKENGLTAYHDIVEAVDFLSEVLG